MNSQNKKNIDLIKSINIIDEYPCDFRELIYKFLIENNLEKSKIIDFGCSLREYSLKISNAALSYTTADINLFDNIDIAFDLCNSEEIPKELNGKFNHIVALAIMEHVWQPFEAAKNLVKLLDKSQSSRIWIYAPFLFSYHAPESLVFQDYFRYTKDAWPILFPDAKKITISPVRGRCTTSLNLLIPGYKKIMEQKFSFLKQISKQIDKLYSKKQNSLQTSGYNIIVDY